MRAVASQQDEEAVIEELGEPLLEQTQVVIDPSHRKKRRAHPQKLVSSSNGESSSLVATEAREFFQLVWPVALTAVLEFVPSLASIVVVGRFCDRNALDGAALGTMYFNVAALSIGLGLTTALDTLAPQAVGAKKDHLLGVYVQRGAVVLGVAFLALLFPALFCGAILKGLGQPPQVATRAGVYVRWMLPSLPCYWGFELLRKVFHAFSVVEPLVVIGAGSTLLHCVLAYLFVKGDIALPFTNSNFKGTGFAGAALARSISMCAALAALFAYAVASRLTKRFWNGFVSWKVIVKKDDLMTFLKLGGAGCAAICFEWWAFECLAIFAGLLKKRPDVFIGAHAVLFNLAALFYMVLSGCASAASVRTGLALGSGRPDRAKMATRVALAAALVVGVANAVVLYACRDVFPKLFDKDGAVRKVAALSMPALAIYQVFDAFNAVAGGVMRGAARQTTPAVIMLLAYYVFGIPAALIFAFTPLDLRLVGLWLGLTFGLTVASALFALNLGCVVDWNDLAKEALERTRQDSLNNPDLAQGEDALVEHDNALRAHAHPTTTTTKTTPKTTTTTRKTKKKKQQQKHQNNAPLLRDDLEDLEDNNDDHVEDDDDKTHLDENDDADELDTLDLDSDRASVPSRTSGYGSSIVSDAPSPSTVRTFPRVGNYFNGDEEKQPSPARRTRPPPRVGPTEKHDFDDDGGP